MITSADKLRAPFRQIHRVEDESFELLVFRGTMTGCSWHFHPEYQIAYVIKGRGERVVGDSVLPIQEGELILLGSNLPHVWRFDNTESDPMHVLVIHFSDDFLGSELFAKPEMCDVRLLLARAALGLQASGNTRQQAAELICEMVDQSGLQRVLSLLSLLHVLAGSEELSELCSAGFQPLSADLEIERLRRVCAYIQSNLEGGIDRDSAARIAHLSPSAFSRFFKAHTGKTFQEYVVEVRIGHACRLLMEQEFSVTEIAWQCGFSDVSSFNRSFRRVRGTSPTEFRRRIISVTESRQLCDA